MLNIPTNCPCCGSPVVIKQEINTKTLVCENPLCEGQIIAQFEYFVSKPCMDIVGLSRATIEQLYAENKIKTFKDLYTLTFDDVYSLEGFKEKSAENLISAISKSRNTTLTRFITSLGIPTIGKNQAKQIAKYCDNIDNFFGAVKSNYDWTILDGFGTKTSEYINSFDYTKAKELLPYLQFENKQSVSGGVLNGLTFCITGKLETYSNRDALVAVIEENGGKFTSVSKTLNYLISNDKDSNSGKTKKAKDLGIAIITEVEFNNMLK